MLAAGIVFPVVLPRARARRRRRTCTIHNVPLFVFVLVFASLLGSAFGLLIGTMFEPRKVPLIFSVVVAAVHVSRLHLLPVGDAERRSRG